MSVVPAVKVFQLFETTLPTLGITLDALLIGPNYKVLDYLRAEDKQTSFAGVYNNLDFEVLQYPGRDPGDAVDQNSVQVFFDDLKAEIFSGTDGTTDTLEPTILTAGTPGFYFEDFVDKDGVLHAQSTLLHSRGAKVGDFLKITSGSVEHEAQILEIQSSNDPSVIGTPTANSLNHENLGFVDSYLPFGPVTEMVGPTALSDMVIGVKGVYESFIESPNTYTLTVNTAGTIAAGTAILSIDDVGTDFAGPTLIPLSPGVNDYPVGNRGLILHFDETTTGFTGTGGDWDIIATAPTLSDGVITKAGAFGSGELADIEYTITVLDGNNQGLNTIVVTTLGAIDNSGPTQITSGVSFPVGNKGARAIIDLPSGSKLVPGDSWTLQARAKGHGDTEVISGAGADTVEASGSYLGNEDAVLRITIATGGGFGTADFNWEIYQAGFTDVAAQRPNLANDTGSAVPIVGDASTVYSLGLGIDVIFTDDGGSFTGSKVFEIPLFADLLELPTVKESHDLSADTPSTVTLEVKGDELNYSGPGAISGTTGVIGGSHASSGRYFHETDAVYSITATVAGALGTILFDVQDSGTDIPAGQTIQTQAGVFRYKIGTRGVELVVTSDYEVNGTLNNTIAASGTSDIVLNTGYSFTSPIVYTITCTVTGVLGTAEFNVTSTGNVDNSSFVTTGGVFDYAVGSRGVVVTLVPGTAASWTINNSWVIDTTRDTRLTATQDHTYTIEISRSGTFGTAEVFVTSNLGDSTGPFTLLANTDPRNDRESLPFAVGNFGIQAILTDGDTSNPPGQGEFFHKGDKWTVVATAEAARGKNRLKLSRTIPTLLLGLTGLTYSLSLQLDDVNIPPTGSINWTTDDTTVTMYPGITVTSPDVFDTILGQPVLFEMAVLSGANMYITYRALVTSGTSTIDTVTSVSEIEGKLGRIDPDNVLAFAAAKALENTNTQVKFLRIGSDDDLGYQSAIDFLENTSDVYALVPLTQDKTVIEAFDAHVGFMSSPDEANWRILLANRELDTTSEVYTDRVDIISGDTVDLEGIFVDDPNATNLTPPVFTRVEDSNASFLTEGVVAGDLLLTDFVNGKAQSSYPIDQVISEDILILFDGPSSEILLPQKYEIVRPLSKTEQAEAYAAIAESTLDRRVYLIWPDKVDIDGVEVEGFFLCAAIAGLIAGLPPHQGFTNLGMAGFDSVPRTTRYFNRDQLNIMALAGVYIVTQKSEESAVFARHQLSTDRTSLETQELSITKNLDFLSFYFQQLLEPFIGVYNVTPSLLTKLNNILRDGIAFQESQELENIGAPLISGNVLSVTQNEASCDIVDIELELNLPCPLNFINLRLRVVTS